MDALFVVLMVVVCATLPGCTPEGNEARDAEAGAPVAGAAQDDSPSLGSDTLAADSVPVADSVPAAGSDPAALSDPAAATAAEASRLLEASEFAASIPLWRDVIDVRTPELGAEHELVGRAWHNLSFALSEVGDEQAALDAATRSVEIAVAAGAPSPHTAMAHRHLAEVAERAGRWSLAWGAADAACKDFEASYGKTPMTGEAHEFAARLCLRVGDREGAESHAHWAVAIAEHVFGASDPLATTRPMVGLAQVLASGGRVDAALQVLEHVGLLLAAGGFGGGPEWQTAFSNRLALLESLGEHDIVIELLGDVADHIDASDTAGRRARIDHALRLAVLGDPVRATAVLPTQGDQASEDGTTPGVEQVAQHAVRAEIALRSGRPDEALAAVLAGLDLVGPAEAGNPLATAPMHLLHGRVLLAAGQAEPAVEVLLGLFDRVRRARGEDHPILVETLLALSVAEQRAHGVTVELLDALGMAEAALGQLHPERIATLWRQDGVAAPPGRLSDLVAGHLAAADVRESHGPVAFQAVDRLRECALLEPLAWWIERGAAVESSDLLELLELRRQDAAGVVALAQRPAQQEQAAAAIERLRAGGSRLADLVQPRGASLEEARGLLAGQHERLLLFSWTGADVWCQLVGHEAPLDRLVSLGPPAPLAARLAFAQAELRDLDSTCELSDLAHTLLGSLWEDLAEVTRVLIVADGPLAFLPFEALPVPAGNQSVGGETERRPWAQRCQVVYGTSVARLVRGAARPGGERSGGVHVYAGAKFSERPVPDQFARLSGRFEVTPSLGRTTTDAVIFPEDEQTIGGRQALESALAQRSADGGLTGRHFVELVVPGYVDAAVPSATALVLGPEPEDERALWEREDGLWTLPELGELSLDVDVVLLPMVAVGPDPTAIDLNPAGMHALVASLGDAGARNVLVSQWSRTGPPRGDFDRLLLRAVRDGNAADALWRVQRDWLQSNRDARWKHPAVWARYRHFGS